MPRALDRWSGDEHCRFCLQAYVFQLEVYCAECDRPVCPLCTRHRPGGAGSVCPECVAAVLGEES